MTLTSLEHSPRAYRFDLLFYATSPWLMAAVMGVWAPAPLWLKLSGWALAGGLLWTLLEYLLHRFVLHGRTVFSQLHHEHHQRPRALIGLPTLFSVGLIALLVGLPSLALLHFWPAVALTWGVFTGYAVYTWMHHAMHHAPHRRSLFRQHRRIHARHHALHRRSSKGGAYFGVTTQLWDRVFRTVTPATS